MHRSHPLPPEGIFVEELRRELDAACLKIRFLGVNQRALKKLAKELQSLIDSEPLVTNQGDRVELSVLAT